MTEQIIVDLNDDITFHYIARFRHHTDELGLVVQGHLLIEFILNEMIRHSLRRPSDILKDHRSYTFAIKARILFSANLLPGYIFRSIERVNSIRNHLAHCLDWSSLTLDYRFSQPDDEEEHKDLDPRNRRGGRGPHARRYMKMPCFGTLSQLRNHFVRNYGTFPVPEKRPW